MAHHTPTTVRDVPWALLIIGAVFFGIGAILVLSAPREARALLGAGACGGTGLLLVALPSVLTVRADHARGVLVVTRRSLLRRSVQEIPLRLIASVDVETCIDNDGNTYRIVITRSDGTVFPLRAYYSSGDHEPMAQRLRELVAPPGG